MKNKYLVSAAVLMLMPALSHAGAINWTSQSYNIFTNLELNSNQQTGFNTSVSSLESLPLSNTASLIDPNGFTAATLAIKDLSNSTADIIELALDTQTNYKGGTNASTQSSYAVSTASVENTFVTNNTTLKVAYDYSSTINFNNPQGSSDSGRPSATNYQLITFSLENVNTGVVEQFVNFNKFYLNSAPSPTAATYTGSNAFEFIVTTGTPYKVLAEISPDMFSSGTIDINNSQSILKISLSNTVTAVPEPEAYAMLLAGLALVGFTARRKQQA